MNLRRGRWSLLVGLLVAGLIACAKSATAPEPTAARGVIDTVVVADAGTADEASLFLRVFVRAASPDDRSGMFGCSGSAEFAVTSRTRIKDERGGMLQAADLAVGQTVTVWEIRT